MTFQFYYPNHIRGLTGSRKNEHSGTSSCSFPRTFVNKKIAKLLIAEKEVKEFAQPNFPGLIGKEELFTFWYLIKFSNIPLN